MKALCTSVGACQEQVTDCPSNTTIAVVERVQGDKPEMPKAGLEQWRFGRWAIEPIEEPVHFQIKVFGGWRLKMYALAANRSGNDLHGTTGIVSPATNLDFGQTGVAGTRLVDQLIVRGRSANVATLRLAKYTCNLRTSCGDYELFSPQKQKNVIQPPAECDDSRIERWSRRVFVFVSNLLVDAT